ncbi:conserved hypothetical protein [Ricinus communis]|uniref:Uncharacterized protein n=1 Tax=Ricinus communis TaxID=3988 RepID=B9SL92_RICCO|nr:conserved hypothetical protein [Ricinus communis]
MDGNSSTSGFSKSGNSGFGKSGDLSFSKVAIFSNGGNSTKKAVQALEARIGSSDKPWMVQMTTYFQEMRAISTIGMARLCLVIMTEYAKLL